MVNRIRNDAPIIDAYCAVLQRHRVSVDELLATPAYRDLFLSEARRTDETADERDLLLRLISLRKRSKLPRSRDCDLNDSTIGGGDQ